MASPAVQTDSALTASLKTLASAIGGEVRTDRLSRAVYATDASIYEMVPDAVVLPKTIDDVAVTVSHCKTQGLKLTPRGAGTGLTGGAVNRGVQLDCSRYLNRILDIDPQARTARVEPGVVLDALNAALGPHGLQFAPDVATSSRATIGGMIANNSCGSHSVIYGRTVDHLQAVELVLSDGSRCIWGDGADTEGNALADACVETLGAIAEDYADEIEARFPKVMRSNGGYGLDRLRRDGGRINPEAIICGSEGTLGVVVGATLKLVPLPAHKGLLVVHFQALLAALEATPVVLEHGPAAVELVDSHIIQAARSNPALMPKCAFIEGQPQALLIVELFDENERLLKLRLEALSADLKHRSMGYARRCVMDPSQQADVWEMRKAGLGLLMSRPGDSQPYAFVEDTCVDPKRLAEYIGRFQEVLQEEGCQLAGYYAHASVGVIHVRPVLNLKDGRDLARLQRIADRISSLALEYGGTPTGEHGDGIVRSCWLPKIYGPKIMEAFARIKQVFDPDGTFNPGKIVDPWPVMENLRYGEAFTSTCQFTALDFSKHGGMAGLAGMCSGVGQCRQKLVGTMCPSYMATGDERHTTRARANALRMALSNRDLLEGLADPALDEVMDLCLGCKACKTECPTGTDLAKLKAEWLFARHRQRGVPKRNRFIAQAPELATWGSRFAPLSNWLVRSAAGRGWLEQRYGLDRRVLPPRFFRKTFRQGFARYRRKSGPAPPQQPRVVYFVDTWTNHHCPQVGWAVVKVLEALGYRVVVARTQCCGRPAISQGLLGEAKLLARQNVDILAGFAGRGMPIVVSEPSCLSALIDDWPALVQSRDADRVARRAISIEGFLAGELGRRSERLRFVEPAGPVLYHSHCHQKALWGSESAMAVLEACTGGRASLIDSGCCGMAGAFGHEVEHYDIARAIGEERLFPAVRNRGEAEVVVSGFSCGQQIEHHTEVNTRHVVELLAGALG